MRDVVVHELIQRHNTADGPDRDIRLRQEAPDAKLPRIGMALLEVIHLHHPWEPDFA
jgi:hypothetical protein